MVLPDNPISVPENPFWHVGKRFGRDELIAFFINLAGTLIASFFITSAFALSIVGPVVEKIGFFPAHFFEALKIYRTTPEQKRKKLRIYLSKAFRGGLVSLTEDVCIHDPLYVALFFLLTFYPGIPLWLVVSFSFVFAVFIVAIIDVLISEGRYFFLKLELSKTGFERESFLESRFLIKKEMLIEDLAAKFRSVFPDLSALEEREYEDVYFENKFHGFSGRTPTLRLRKRTLGYSDNWWLEKFKWADELGLSQSAQLIYTRSREERGGEPDQFRFFPVEKDKFSFMLNQPMPRSFAEVEDGAVKKFLEAHAGQLIKKISFKRSVFTSGKGELFVAVDAPREKDFYIIEIKTWGNAELLMMMMRFVMIELPVTQTTRAKINIE